MTGVAPPRARCHHAGVMPPNRLAAETSPYLLQHADNPVDWLAWADVARSVAQIVSGLARCEHAQATGRPLAPTVPRRAAEALLAHVDRADGGLGGAPKFPHTSAFQLFLRQHRATGNPALPDVVLLTCERMARGGVYDQVGGGFHRYAVDARWLVPHFEKMLYDNAQLARLYLEA